MSIPTVRNAPDVAGLSSADLQRLTLFKWRYTLEAKGFAADECDRLLFLRWLQARHPRVLQ